MKHLKKTTFGVVAASLILSQAAFADQPTTTNAATTTTTDATTTSTDTNTQVSNIKDLNKFTNKLDKIESKLEQFNNQQTPEPSLSGNVGSIENRIDAIKGQLDKLAEFQKQIDQLKADEAKQTADSLEDLFNRAGDLKSAVDVEKLYVQKKLDKKSSDEDILKEYKQLGQLLRKMGKQGVQALVNGQEPSMDVPPVIENGRTLLPFRALAESLGAQVSYDPATRIVTVTKGDTKVTLTIDSVSASVNGQPYTLDVPAEVVQGRTLIPLRFLGQSLNAKVLWEQDTQMAIVIGDQNNNTTEVAPGASSTTSTTTNTTSNTTTGSTEVVSPTQNSTTTGTTEVTPNQSTTPAAPTTTTTNVGTTTTDSTTSTNTTATPSTSVQPGTN